MANLLIPWQRYLSDIAHKYVGYEEGDDMGKLIQITVDDNDEISISTEEIIEGVKNGNSYCLVIFDDETNLPEKIAYLANIYKPTDSDYYMEFIGYDYTTYQVCNAEVINDILDAWTPIAPIDSNG